ncbi:MAG: hypothetical protein V4538_17290 [Bacteroidota bacterium]
MSYFDFPRINFTGDVIINVGTVNNDDYSASPNVTYIAEGAGKGEILRLSNTLAVQAVTHGMTDEEFIPWSQAPVATCDVNGNSTGNMIPGEWNYYGDMSVTFQNANVVGVNLADGTLQTSGNPIIGTNVSFNNDSGRSTALICDVNPEDVPSSQIFADVFSLRDSSGNALFQGKPSKAVTRWINFQRNANLNASAGASGLFQSVIPISDFSDPGVQNTLKSLGMDTSNLPSNLKGFMVRYTVYKTIPPITPSNYPDNDTYLQALVDLYAKPFPANQNPGVCTVSGSIGLWYEDEMQSITMGRLLVQPNQSSTFSTGPYKNNNSGGNFYLGPTVAKLYSGTNRLTLDVSNTFPELYQKSAADIIPPVITNNKFDITQYNGNGHIVLGVITSASSTLTIITILDYANTPLYLNQGGLLDLTIPANLLNDVQTGSLVIMLQNADGSNGTILLQELDYMIASDQACVFGEQGQTDNLYRNDAPQSGTCTINVYYKGAPITSPVNLVMQEAITTPNNLDKMTGVVTTLNMTPANNNQLPLTFNTSASGNRLYRIALEVPTAPEPNPLTPVTSYGSINVMTDFYINIRILPTDDYSTYVGSNGKAIQPIPWDYLYANVLQYYSLIFPAMVIRLPFVQSVWQDSAAMIYERVDVATWDSVMYMPRTRDLSNARRQLMQAWLLQYMPTPPSSNNQSA